MQLVKTEWHNANRHWGGAAIWKRAFGMTAYK